MNVTLQTLLPDRSLPPALAARPVGGLALDSRRLRPGDAFIAVPGGSVDGRAFIDAAIAAGAVAVLAENDTESTAEVRGVPVLGIPALHRQVGDIAGRWAGEPARQLRVFGITGTNGKTSTAWFLCAALGALGIPCGLVGTLGMRFGELALDTGHTTPDPVQLHGGLARLRAAGARAVAMEVSSHALVQHRLSGVPVSVAVFTNLSRDHLDYHGDEDSYFAAKARLFERPELTLAVINEADARAATLIELCRARGLRVIGYNGADATVRCRDWQPDEAGMTLRLALDTDEITVRTPLYGRFNLENLMAVAAVVHGLGHDAAAVARALAAVTPVPGRMETVAAPDAPRVLVDYAHTPDGLEKALSAVREHFHGRVWCVVGCGGDRDRGKRPLMAAVAERLADRLVFTADNPRSEDPLRIIDEMLQGVRAAATVRVQPDRALAIAETVAAAAADDVILIAGKGHEASQEIAGRKIPMDDRELARHALARRGGRS